MSSLLRHRELPAPSERIALGKRGLRVSPLCIGMVSDPRTIPYAFDAGINFFFVSTDLHWPLYEPTRKGLKMLLARSPSIREQVVIAGASYITQVGFWRNAYPELIISVPRLSYIDVPVIGATYTDFNRRRAEYGIGLPLAKKGEHRTTRAFGCSFHDREVAAEALSDREIDIAFVRYNTAHLGLEKEVLPSMSALRGNPRPRLFTFSTTKSFLDASRFGNVKGKPLPWQPRRVDHYRFALTQKRIDGILCSPMKPREVRGIVDALAEGPLKAEELDYMRRLPHLKFDAKR
ncbi:MAG: hypothetical protein U0174_15905 [Polyangiaceae bacterium]